VEDVGVAFIIGAEVFTLVGFITELGLGLSLGLETGSEIGSGIRGLKIGSEIGSGILIGSGIGSGIRGLKTGSEIGSGVLIGSEFGSGIRGLKIGSEIGSDVLICSEIGTLTSPSPPILVCFVSSLGLLFLIMFFIFSSSIGICEQILTNFGFVRVISATDACFIFCCIVKLNPLLLGIGISFEYNPIKYANITAIIMPNIALLPKYLLPFENKLIVARTKKKNCL
jgi:hypothetical protein